MFIKKIIKKYYTNINKYSYYEFADLSFKCALIRLIIHCMVFLLFWQIYEYSEVIWSNMV